MKDRIKDLLTDISFEVIVVALMFVASVFVFAYIAHEAVLHNEAAFDEKVFQFFASYMTEELVIVMRFFTLFGKPEFMIPAYLIMVGWFLYQKKYHYATSIFIIGLTSLSLLFALKGIFERERPALPVVERITNYSFPSGHALLVFELCSVFIYLIWQSNKSPAFKWLTSLALLIFAFFVGVSRILLRVHYATDVLAGFCLGFGWSLLSFWFMNMMRRRYLNKNNTRNQQFA